MDLHTTDSEAAIRKSFALGSLSALPASTKSPTDATSDPFATQSPFEQLHIPRGAGLSACISASSGEAFDTQSSGIAGGPESLDSAGRVRLSPQQEAKLFKELADTYQRFLSLAELVPAVPPPTKVGLCMKYIQAVCNCCSTLDEGIDSLPQCSPAEAQEVVERLQSLRTELLSVRDQLVSANEGLVFYAVKSLCQSDQRKKVKDDLVAAGMVGLLQAVDGYNPEYGYRFSTYAFKAIRSSVYKALCLYGLSRRKQEGIHVLSLHDSTGREDAFSLLEALQDTKATPPDAGIEIRDELESVRARVLDKLDQVQLSTAAQTKTGRALLRAVLGLAGEAPMSIQAAARSLNVSTDRAKDIFRIALTQAGLVDQSAQKL